MKLKILLCSAAAMAAAGLILFFPKEMTGAVSAGCRDCFEVIIPSLFAFTILAVFLQKSGLYRFALKPLTYPLSKLLRTDEEICALIILSNIGGYPVGAKLLSTAVREGRLSPRDAGRLMCCCFGSGPSFVIGLAGMRVFGSAAAGGAMFAACLATSLIMALAVRSRGEFALIGSRAPLRLGAETLIDSVTDAARVMFTVCAMITGFSAIACAVELTGLSAAAQELFRLLNAGDNAGRILPALLEVSRIKELAPSGGWVLALCCGMLEFGGVCVLLQVAALAKGIPLKAFLLSRIPAAIIGAALSIPAALRLSPALPAIADGASVRAFSSGGALGFCVFMMCVILLGFSREKSA